jgi:uncharacterized repeat protein (TIGR03803 family)
MNSTKTLPVSAVLVFAICIFSLAMHAQAQTFTTLVNFNGTDGAFPRSAPIQAADGNFYGTTEEGGASGKYGTVYKMTAGGSLTSLYSFMCDQTTCPEGANPEAGLIQGYDGDLYGVTQTFGASTDGAVFKITPGGELTTLHSFSGGDGDAPLATLIQVTNGSFYGTTDYGGIYNFYGGTIFSITPDGTLTTLHSFNVTDGGNPVSSVLQTPDGNFYGTTYDGGADGQGTIFKITSTGSLTTLHSFYPSFTAGRLPYAGLVLGTDENFYGTTSSGTTSKNGTGSGCGTVFKVTPLGTITTLHIFHNAIDGCDPYAPLIQATDGNFYGTTPGTIFQITPTGTLTTLHTFSGTEGPGYAGLLQATDGNFYGITASGGANGDGTIFRLSMGFGPFVKTLPTSGKVGATVEILGTDLTGTTSVSFNGQAAAFTVVSASEITANVPADATTGTLKVAIPNGVLLSNVPFRVTP